jgi:hypothetical protein
LGVAVFLGICFFGRSIACLFKGGSYLDGNLICISGLVRFWDPVEIDAVLASSWDDVYVEMRNHLAGGSAVVLDEVAAFGVRGLNDGVRGLLCGTEGGGDFVRRGMGDCFEMLLGEYERVTGGYGVDVEDDECLFVLIDARRWNLTGNDFAKNAVCHMLPSSIRAVTSGAWGKKAGTPSFKGKRARVQIAMQS